LIIVFLSLLFSTVAHAQGRQITFIRDAEIEDSLRSWSAPVFRAAGLSPDAVTIYIIQDNTLNAFVAGGQNVFLHTGLLQRSEHAGQVIGVIAHEVGHISGGHLARLQAELANASATAIVGYILGAAAAVASGSGDVGAAILTGSTQVAERSLLSYSRTQERAADQAAVTFLDAMHLSSKGLLEFMRILDEDSLWRRGNQNPYIRSHPLTTERIRFLENHVAASKYSNTPLSQQLHIEHQRIIGKLNGFLSPPMTVLQRVRALEKRTLADDYAEVIALYRLPDLKAADTLIQRLYKLFPNDPYLLELQGQMNLEAGKGEPAVAFYQQALAQKPNSPMIRFGTARALISTASKKDTHKLIDARTHLQFVTKKEPRNASAWRFLSIVHGRLGDIGLAQLSLAEEAYSRDDLKQLRFQLARAEKIIEKESAAGRRIADLQKYLEDNEKKQ
jgi:predicted Zn-dependent protease